MAGSVPVCVVCPYLLVAQAVAAGLRSTGTLAEARPWEAAVRERDPLDPDPRLPGRMVAVLVGVEDRGVVEEVERLVQGGVVRVLVVTSDPPPVMWGGLLEIEALDVVSTATSVAELARLVEDFAAGRSSMDTQGRTELTDAWRVAEGRRQQLAALLETLSPQQRRVLDLLASGRRVDEVGEVIGVARGTVRSHVKAMRAKLGARSQLEAVAMLNEISDEGGGVGVPRPRREWSRPASGDDWTAGVAAPAVLSDHALAAWAAERAGSLLLDVRAEAEVDGLAGHTLREAGREAARREVERILSGHRPDDAVVAEAAAPGSTDRVVRRAWLIHPLDGAKDFCEPSGAEWTVHVALWEDGDLVAGAVAQPGLGELYSTGRPVALPHRASDRLRIAVSRSDPARLVEKLTGRLDADLLPTVSAGAGVTGVLRGVVDAYVRGGRHRAWQTAALVAVARAAGLHCSGVDGSPLVYDPSARTSLPDLVVCRPELARAISGGRQRGGAARAPRSVLP